MLKFKSKFRRLKVNSNICKKKAGQISVAGIEKHEKRIRPNNTVG
jgi:hypothetical protein